jgi:hypothetical protein
MQEIEHARQETLLADGTKGVKKSRRERGKTRRAVVNSTPHSDAEVSLVSPGPATRHKSLAPNAARRAIAVELAARHTARLGKGDAAQAQADRQKAVELDPSLDKSGDGHP